MFRIIFGAFLVLTLSAASMAFVGSESVNPEEGDLVVLSLTGTALKGFKQSSGMWNEGSSTAEVRCVLAKVSSVHLESRRVTVSAFEVSEGDLRTTARVIRISGNAPMAALNPLDTKFGNLPSEIVDSVLYGDIYGVSQSAGIVPTFVMPVSEFQQADRNAIRLQLTAFEAIKLSR